MMLRTKMTRTIMSTVLIIIRKVWERWLTQNGSDGARQLKAPAAAHSASSAQHPTEWGSRTRASFLKVSLFIKLALFWEQVTTKLWKSLVTIGHQWLWIVGNKVTCRGLELYWGAASEASSGLQPFGHQSLPYTSTAGSTSTPRTAELPTCVPYIGNKSSSGSGNALEGWSLTWCCNRGPGRVF